MVKPRRTKWVASCVKAQSVPNCSRRAVAPSDSISAGPSRLPRWAESMTSERTSATVPLSGASSAQPTSCVAAHDDEEALGVAAQVVERARQQVPFLEAGRDQRVHRLGLVGRATLDRVAGRQLAGLRDVDGGEDGHGHAPCTAVRAASRRDSASAISALGDDVRRQQPHDALGRAVDDEAALERRGDHRRGIAIEHQALHQAGAAHLDDHRVLLRQRAQPVGQDSAPTCRTCSSRPLLERVEHGQRGAAGQRVAAVGRAVVAGG